MKGEGICGLVVGSLEPLGCEVVCHDACLKTLHFIGGCFRGLWSVTTVKWLMPARKLLHFLMAQETARHSSSMTAYLLSVSVRNRDLLAQSSISFLLSADFWRRTNPNPSVLASVYRRVSLILSKYAKVGTDVSAFFVLREGFVMWLCPQKLVSSTEERPQCANTSVM